MCTDVTEEDFDSVIEEVHRRANKECGYPADVLWSMYEEHGGVETARQLLAPGQPPKGFDILVKCGCPEITVEAQVLKKPWRKLFTEKELRVARGRLESRGYDVSKLISSNQSSEI